MNELEKISALILQLEQKRPIRELDWVARTNLPYQSLGLVLHDDLLLSLIHI